MSIWLIFTSPFLLPSLHRCPGKNPVPCWKENKGLVFADVLNRDICLEHRVRTAWRCPCLPAFFFRADWLDLPSSFLQDNQERFPVSLFPYLWRAFTCVVILSSLPPDTVSPSCGELWSCPSSLVVLGGVWSSSHPPISPPLSQVDLGLGSRHSHVFFPFPFRIFQLLSSLPFSDSTLDS